jgi:hypothetical protein
MKCRERDDFPIRCLGGLMRLPDWVSEAKERRRGVRRENEGREAESEDEDREVEAAGEEARWEDAERRSDCMEGTSTTQSERG